MRLRLNGRGYAGHPPAPLSPQNDLPLAAPPPCWSVQSKPQLLAWLTCDGVHIDPARKHTILGIFSNIQARQFPVTHPFIDLVPHDYRLLVRSAQVEDLDGLGPTRMQQLPRTPVRVAEPLHRINLINEIRNLSFPAPGDYALLV